MKQLQRRIGALEMTQGSVGQSMRVFISRVGEGVESAKERALSEDPRPVDILVTFVSSEEQTHAA